MSIRRNCCWPDRTKYPNESLIAVRSCDNRRPFLVEPNAIVSFPEMSRRFSKAVRHRIRLYRTTYEFYTKSKRRVGPVVFSLGYLFFENLSPLVDAAYRTHFDSGALLISKPNEPRKTSVEITYNVYGSRRYLLNLINGWSP